jgi:hypothetical protein
MRRNRALETVKGFPQKFNFDQRIEKLVFVEKIEKGLKQLDDGRTVDHDKVKEITKKWFFNH